ncbi:MAG: hypothetical protein A3B37_01440 [Candidatus Sungbacteria bacterium RIFCSPLOWO2_01_FULL_59_16]|uniref:Endolytic murein transglycosylase n=1 Tax=Candidatus Sungbacteria bacterium RIFCSPLOWO2_01_FULL_59_16 TaxID=1802280 RepID=A0A1G2LC46_9BACT|nr:MAG: hypothetical protein A3B37_01440 [Candidatus Sungbacteria bacterium RIFCSPLOWO2_01_FULL_59_16]
MNNEQERTGGERAKNTEPTEGRGRRPRMPLAVSCSLLILLALAGYAAFAPLRVPEGRLEIEIPAGSSSRAIGELFQSRGLLRSKWTFVAYATLAGEAQNLKAGNYEFFGRVTVPELVQALSAGKSNERIITVPEGWDLSDLGRYFEREGMFPAAELYAVTGAPPGTSQGRNPKPKPKDFSKEFPTLADKPPSAGLEGYLFPDTYRIFRDAPIKEIARKMLANFERRIDPELRAEIARQGKSVFEIITVASLVEKEIPHAEDRPIVGGILWERLRRGLPLQVDASVNYATGKRETPSAADLALDSPYNTYRVPGLPAGPIANPGLGAIRAAVYPERSSYLYYLSAPDGRTVFSRTLEEHNAAKVKYLK